MYVKACVVIQGFASGSLDDDAFAPRFFVDQGLEVMVSQSYSKNLGEPFLPPRMCVAYIWLRSQTVSSRRQLQSAVSGLVYLGQRCASINSHQCHTFVFGSS